jgi:membrane protease YdiL (CAAX protease family)
MPGDKNSLIRRHPVVSYFVLTFAISWAGALAVAGPRLIRHEGLSSMTGILMFPAMLLGPSCSALFLTKAIYGPLGLRDLLARLSRFRLPLRWYGFLLLPPILILVVLLFLKAFVSPAFTPNRYYLGILFGVPAGLLEEIGWTGYAFPKMRSQQSGFASSILLGLLWGCWHVPVINYLGTATPHGEAWLAFFLAFAFAMTAMRVLISWIYDNTQSVLLAQLMHISSTGSLVFFSPPAVTAMQEVRWYAMYGIVLWVAVCAIVGIAGRSFRSDHRPHLVR